MAGPDWLTAAFDDIGGALPLQIAARATLAMLAVMLAVFSVLSVTTAIKQRTKHVGDLIGRVFGATFIFAIPLAVAIPVGVLASAFLIGVGAPAITYVFMGFAALVSFRTAVNHSSDGMEGCTRMIGLSWSGYAILWSGVSFQATDGLHSFETEALSLRLLQPPLAALPFALAVLKLSERHKRNAWLFLGFWAIVAAIMALCFFPIERGFAEGLLPRSDWLRFPLVGLAIAALLFLVRLAFVARLKPNIRRARLRDLQNGMKFVATIMVAMGLAWAGARALVGALV